MRDRCTTHVPLQTPVSWRDTTRVPGTSGVSSNRQEGAAIPYTAKMDAFNQLQLSRTYLRGFRYRAQ